MTEDRSPPRTSGARRWLRHTLRIARWEIASGASGIDRRALLAALAGIVTIAGIGGGALALGLGTPPDEGIYRVGVTPDSPYYEPIAQDPKFAIVDTDPPFSYENLTIVVDGRQIGAPGTAKGRAAAAELKAAVQRYNDRLMRNQPDQVAAFPVNVILRYVDRGSLARDETGDGNNQSGDTGGKPDEQSGNTSTATPTDTGTDASGTGGVGGGSGGGAGLPNFGVSVLTGQSSGTPSDIRPPFPFTSLVLAFAFVVPMNFVIQAYASSVLHERTNRRGELMLVAPVSRWSIIAGKTLPYFATMLAIAGLTAVGIGGGLLSLAAVTPVALLFLSCAFVGALLARSHKELTFVLVTVSVAVTTYVFVPAIFTDIHPIAAISPLTMVVRELEGVAVSPGTFAFSTGPVLLASAVLFTLGSGLYREEDLFAQRPIPAKVLDALATPISSRWSAGFMSVLLLPFVFLGELLMVALLFVLPFGVSLPILLASLAAIEEIGKSIHLYAGFERAKYGRSLRATLRVGAISGAGFFLGEKLAAAAQLVGLQELDVGRAAFQLGAGTGGAGSPLLLLGLLLAPLALHVVSTSLSALGARRGRYAYVLGLGAAITVHTLYNLVVVMNFVG